MRPIIRVIRVFLAGFLCVGVLVVIAFLIVVDIIDGIPMPLMSMTVTFTR